MLQRCEVREKRKKKDTELIKVLPFFFLSTPWEDQT